MTPFEKAYQQGIEGLHAESSGFVPDCQTCQDNHGFDSYHEAHDAYENNRVADEGSFSWQSCDICGSHLGGYRYAAHALDDDNEIVHLEICTDCLFYMAYGDLPENWE